MALVLVIEDNDINLELMTFLLQAHGHRTRTAADGAAGLAQAQAERPDLVICDLQMPGLDGYDVAARVRADPALRTLPLVAVTAAAMVGDRDKALAAGFDAHVAKPIDPQTFVTLIEAFLPGPSPAPDPPQPGESLGGGQVSAELRAPREGLVVLLVDDHPTQLEFKRSLLEPAGYRVVTASSPDAAWACLKASPIDLVLSDVVMRGGTGFTLVQRVRGDRDLRRLPFAFLTSTACDSGSMQEGLTLGADAYLMRPIDPLVLLRELRALLAATGRR